MKKLFITFVIVIMLFFIPNMASAGTGAVATVEKVEAGSDATAYGGNASGGSASATGGNANAQTGDSNAAIGNTTAQTGDSNAAIGDVDASSKNEFGDVETKVEYSNDYSQVFEAGESMRPFTNSGGVGFPPVPSFFGPDTQGPTYQKVELLLPLKSKWQRYELDASVTDTDIMFRCRYFMKTRETLIKGLEKRTKSDFFDPLKSSLKENPYDTIYIITAPPKSEFKMIGHITLWAKDKYTTSFELQSKACLLALELPTANAILIMSQGCEKKVETDGWGVSIGNSTATINGNQDVSTVTSPALGYSTGEAGNTGRPWLQVAIIQ